MKDYVRCERCHIALTTRKKENPIKIICERCSNGDFSSEKFSIHHYGLNSWAVKNENGDLWCGKHEWVNEGSSYWGLTDCMNILFTWEELKKFIEKKFSTYL